MAWQWSLTLEPVETDVLDVDTGRRRIVDLTAEVRAFCRTRGDGLCNIFVPHATAGVAVIETGAGMGAGAGALGGLAFDANPGTAALIGAGVGAAAGLLTAPSTSGHCTGGILDGCW